MKKKTTNKWLREKEFEGMAHALARYIKGLGGTAVVVGGVSVGKHIGAREFNYFVQIDITGKMPTKKI